MIYLFDQRENLIDIIPRKEVIHAHEYEKLNNIITTEIETTLDRLDNINKSMYLGYFVNNGFNLFKLEDILPDSNTVQLTSVHTFFDDMAGYGYIRDKRPHRVQAAIPLIHILEGSRWEVGAVNTTNTGSANFYDVSRLEALSKLVENWNVEFVPKMDFDGRRITRRYINLVNQRGIKTGIRLVHGTNALNIRSEETRNIVTAIIARGRGEEIYDDEGEPTGGYGRRIDIKEVEWNKTKGDPINKPKGQEYIEAQNMTEIYGYSDGTPRYKVINYDSEDPEEVIRLAYADLKQICRPQTVYSTSADRIGKEVDIGDSISIIRRDIDLFYETRIIEIRRNLLNSKLTEIILGDVIDYTQAKKNKEVRSALKDLQMGVSDLSQLAEERQESLHVKLQEDITKSMYDDESYGYNLRAGNNWGLPAGQYYFDKPIDEIPTKAIYFGAGKFAIANSKDSQGRWQWKTFGTGDGFVADFITTGTLTANLIRAGVLAGGNGKVTLEMNSGALNIDNDIVYNPASRTTRIRGTTQLDNGIINTAHIQNGAITNAKIGNLSADKITSGTISANRISGGTIDADYITVRNLQADNMKHRELNGIGVHNSTFDTSRLGATKIDGSSVSFSSSSPYITITDRGGRGQVDINGTIAARGVGYSYELNAGGLYGNGGRIIASGGSTTQIHSPSVSSPSIVIESNGTVRIGRLFVGGKEITG